MKKISILLLLLGAQLIFSQTLTKEKTSEQPDTPDSSISSLLETDIPAEFPGGMPALRKHLASEFDASNISGSGTFKSITTFLILKDGSMSSISTTGDNPSLNKEMTRAVKRIKTKWKPVIRNGQPIEMIYRIPMTMNMP